MVTALSGVNVLHVDDSRLELELLDDAGGKHELIVPFEGGQAASRLLPGATLDGSADVIAAPCTLAVRENNISLLVMYAQAALAK